MTETTERDGFTVVEDPTGEATAEAAAVAEAEETSAQSVSPIEEGQVWARADGRLALIKSRFSVNMAPDHFDFGMVAYQVINPTGVDNEVDVMPVVQFRELYERKQKLERETAAETVRVNSNAVRNDMIDPDVVEEVPITLALTHVLGNVMKMAAHMGDVQREYGIMRGIANVMAALPQATDPRQIIAHATDTREANRSMANASRDLTKHDADLREFADDFGRLIAMLDNGQTTIKLATKAEGNSAE